MSMWVNLTKHENNETISIPWNRIVAVETRAEGSTVHIDDGTSVHVSEVRHKVTEMVTNARFYDLSEIERASRGGG